MREDGEGVENWARKGVKNERSGDDGDGGGWRRRKRGIKQTIWNMRQKNKQTSVPPQHLIWPWKTAVVNVCVWLGIESRMILILFTSFPPTATDRRES